jgi:hypothetical protein
MTMLKHALLSVALFGIITTAGVCRADEVNVGNDDTVFSILTAQMGKRVSITTRSGQLLSGTVKAVNPELTHLAALVGKEYYDAVVVNKMVESIEIRTHK